MARIKPFAAVRPNPDLAAKVCELPYDVMSSEEARALASGNPLSFLHVSKPEIDLAPEVDHYSPEVYATGRDNFQKLLSTGVLRQDPQPCFYLYRQIMGQHSQVGIVAVASCEEYLAGAIRKHELTRVDKEDDRVRHIEALNAQTGPVFLTYRAVSAIDELVARLTAEPPTVDFTAPDGVRHTSWVVADVTLQSFIEARFANIPRTYIADGHHRSAAAARISKSRNGQGHSAWFLAVIFPHNQLRILPYNRALRDLNGRTPEALLQELRSSFHVVSGANSTPDRKHELGLYLAGQWYRLSFRSALTAGKPSHEALDVSLLQEHVLRPIFNIEDPRTSQRIQFVGGIRGPRELEKLVDSGSFACAFSMFPTSIEDLMAIADENRMMPPKSTWFEPKLRDAMFSHLIQ